VTLADVRTWCRDRAVMGSALTANQPLVAQRGPNPERGVPATDEIASPAELNRIHTLGRAVTAVAHDFANTLTGIRLYSDLLFERLELSDPRRKHAEQIRFACWYGAALVRSLMGFARRQEEEPRIICLNDVVQSVSQMLRRLISESINVEIECAPGLKSVIAGAVEMQQVIFNLALNARDAMPGGGRLRLATTNLQVTRWLTTETGDMHPGAYVLLEVSDTGVGMNEETRAHLFEPFFTNKEESGTGLGMAIVRDIVSLVGGALQVKSRVGDGTTVRVLFPALESKSSTTGTLPDVSALKGSETLLLVEDNDALQESLAAALLEFGYHVLCASNGREAIQLAEKSPNALDLLITDLTMPGMDGWELAQYLKGMRPELTVLYISGYGPPSHCSFDTVFLPKPFSVDELTRKIREVLDKKASDSVTPEIAA